VNRRTVRDVLKSVVIASALLVFSGGVCAEEVATAFTVIIDPAHGGSDEGVVLSRGVTEKEVTVDIAQLIRRDLEKTGKYHVVLTRDGDRDTSIFERRSAVKKGKPALFISIHVNAGFGSDASGYEIYVAGREMPPNEKAGAIAGAKMRTETINESVRFARIVQRNLNEVFPREGRGIRSAPAAILDGLAVPGVVLELGFATNAANRKKVQEEEAGDAIARQVSASIREYFAGSGE